MFCSPLLLPWLHKEASFGVSSTVCFSFPLSFSQAQKSQEAHVCPSQNIFLQPRYFLIKLAANTYGSFLSFSLNMYLSVMLLVKIHAITSQSTYYNRA